MDSKRKSKNSRKMMGDLRLQTRDQIGLKPMDIFGGVNWKNAHDGVSLFSNLL